MPRKVSRGAMGGLMPPPRRRFCTHFGFLLMAAISLGIYPGEVDTATRGLVKRRRFGGNAGSKSKPFEVVELNPSNIQPSQLFVESGKLNESLIDSRLTPPNYCYYNLQEPKPCMYYTRECNQNLTENVDSNGNCCFGDRFLKKLKSDKDPKFVERLPSLPPGSLGTCAIIGNADNLLRHKWGREIDMHDFVVRFNVKMQGYEKHIGAKTNGLWTKPHYVDRKEDGPQMPTRFHINPKFAPEDLEHIKGIPVLVYGPHLNNKWRAVAKEIYAKYIKEKKKKESKPTGGWARMMAMVEMAHSGACTRLDIYGFSSGGGKYFSRNYQVDDDHSINLEHFCHRLIMHTGMKGKVCVYGE